MDENVRKNFEAIAAYTSDIDLRLMALEMTICDLAGADDEKKALFQKLISKNLKYLLQARMEGAEDIDPELAARIFRGKNPYKEDEEI